MLSLNTEMKEYGIRLTFPQTVYPTGGADRFAGEITRSAHVLHDMTRWRFTAPDGLQGPARKTLAAAQYDALAHWEDNEIS